MFKPKYVSIFIILVWSLSMPGLSMDVSASPAATSPTLGTTGSYSVLAGSTVTNTGSTHISGNVGVAPGTAITGFPPGIVGPPGAIHKNDASAIAAQADNLKVFGVLDQACTQSFGAVDLTATFPSGVGPGVYCSTSSFSLSGNLKLTGSGVWIFKTVSTLITSPGSSVSGGDPCNVWWRIGSSATLNTTTSFVGSIFALTSISMATGATLNGRALAQTGAVTLQSNTINGPICAAQTAATATSTAATGPTATTAAGATATATTTGSTATATSQPAAARATVTPLPVVTALPGTGGAPIRNQDFPWILVIIGGFSATALYLGIRTYRGSHLPKQ